MVPAGRERLEAIAPSRGQHGTRQTSIRGSRHPVSPRQLQSTNSSSARIHKWKPIAIRYKMTSIADTHSDQQQPLLTSGPVSQEQHYNAADNETVPSDRPWQPSGPSTFKRSLGVIDAFGIVISIVIGSGVFTSPGAIDTNVPSPGVALVIWVLGGVLAWTGASTLAELGTAISGEGWCSSESTALTFSKLSCLTSTSI